MGHKSGRSSELLSAMCSLGVPVEMLSFDALSLREQVLHVSQSSVLIGVHGAHLVNMIFLQDSASVVEVLLRTGWCCNPTQKNSNCCMSCTLVLHPSAEAL